MRRVSLAGHITKTYRSVLQTGHFLLNACTGTGNSGTVYTGIASIVSRSYGIVSRSYSWIRFSRPK